MYRLITSNSMKREVLKTNNQYEAMEFGDHFKNGASLKRQTRRVNKMFARFIFFIFITATTLSAISSCNNKVEEQEPEAKKGLYIVDISKETDWDYLIMAYDGSSIFVNVNENTGIPTNLYFKPDINKDGGYTLLFKENGLPDLLIVENHIIYYGNFRGSTYDMALIYPDKSIEYFYDIETEVDLYIYSNNVSTRSSDLGINFDTFDYIKYAVGFFSCAGSFIPVLAPFLSVSCTTFLVELLKDLTFKIIIEVLPLDGFLEDMAYTLYDAFGCASPDFNIFAKIDCVSGLAGTISMLSYIDFDFANSNQASINEAIEKIYGRAKPGDVYIAGRSAGTNYYTGSIILMLWKNGEELKLTTESYEAEAKSVYVSGNDVYIAGYEILRNGLPVTPKLWKNGILQNLTGTRYGTEANSVFVSGKDVYVAGSEIERGALVWKNGVATKLPGGDFARALSVFVSGNDVYIAGYYGIDNYVNVGALLWKNGVEQNLTSINRKGRASSVYVSGDDVYVAGSETDVQGYYIAKLWKNGIDQNLLATGYSSTALSVFVSGNDVYVTGQVSGNTTYATLWKNGVQQNLTDGTNATSVYVSGNDVYVTGYGGRNAILWKNGVVVQTLSERRFDSVFVVE